MAWKDLVARKAYNKRYYEENREALIAYSKRNYEQNRENRLVYKRRWNWKSRYDLSSEEYTRMLIDQAGLCYMCEKPMIGKREPNVDHDHETGYIRALLCQRCNTGLHYIENSEFMEWAKRYLEKFPRW